MFIVEDKYEYSQCKFIQVTLLDTTYKFIQVWQVYFSPFWFEL
jgi:hypothetical protein